MKCLIDNYSKEALENIVKRSNSMSELSKYIGYKTTHGKNYETIQKRLDMFNIDITHFTLSHTQRTLTDKDVFCEQSTVGQNTLRRFYLKRDDIDYKCVKCGTPPIWNGQPLTLQLDHIDGDNKNNLLNNLRWLCPNCHSQTRTFAGKNVSKEKKHYYCVDCGKELSGGQSKRCPECHHLKNRKVERPTKDELLGLLKSYNGNFTAIGRIYQVSDNTIRKWCKQYDLPIYTSNYVKPKPPKNKTNLN